MNFISSLFGGIFEIGKFGVLCVGGVAAVAILTKPKRKTFKPYFKNFTAHELRKENSFLMTLFSNKGASAIEKMSSCDIDDYFVLSVARVHKLDDSTKPMIFIGCFGDWRYFNERKVKAIMSK